MDEPGENCKDEVFGWSRTGDPIPGWVLNESWFTEDGMPIKGYLKQEYYSGEGKGLEGCRPNIELRNKLRCLVHIGVLYATGTFEEANELVKTQGPQWDFY